MKTLTKNCEKEGKAERRKGIPVFLKSDSTDTCWSCSSRYICVDVVKQNIKENWEIMVLPIYQLYRKTQFHE